jgi:hypothetical protein
LPLRRRLTLWCSLMLLRSCSVAVAELPDVAEQLAVAAPPDVVVQPDAVAELLAAVAGSLAVAVGPPDAVALQADCARASLPEALRCDLHQSDG